MAIDPFKSTTYQVGSITNALASDFNGNLIFSDLLNTSGITLTQLIEGLLGGKILFDSSNTFFSDVTNVSDALKYLNQFAYLKDTSRFIYVDQTVSSDKLIEGEIYNSLVDAISWAKSQLYNGYNLFNIMIMGSHKPQGTLEQNSDIGVYEFIYNSDFNPLLLNKNGINLIGIGNPVIRLKNFTGDILNRKHLFEIDTDGVNNNISINFKDISFEFVNSIFTSAIKVKNAPIDTNLKERSGLKLENTTVSFYGGSNSFNRLLDVSTETDKLTSSVLINGLRIGSINNVISNLNEIELIYVDHKDDTLITINDMNFGLNQQPNPNDNVNTFNVTSFTGIKLINGKVVLNNTVLDEKFYWNKTSFANVATKLAKVYNSSKLSINNVNIIRDSYNTYIENSGGITTIKDWIYKDDISILNVFGFDEIFNINVYNSIVPTSGSSGTTGTTGTTGSSGTNQTIKPVKSFWNDSEFAFGIGHRNELRLGNVIGDSADFTNYSTEYGVPFWFNPDTRRIQYYNGSSIITIGEGGGGSGIGKSHISTISTTDFSPTSYSFDGGATFLGFEYIISHYLNLTNRFAFTINVINTSTGRVIIPQEIISLDENNIKIILGDVSNITVTIIGF